MTTQTPTIIIESIFSLIDEYKTALTEVSLPILLEIKERNTDILYITSKSVDFGVFQKNVFTNLFNKLELKGLHSLRVSITKIETFMNEYSQKFFKLFQNFEDSKTAANNPPNLSKNQKNSKPILDKKMIDSFQKVKDLVLEDFEFRNSILRDLKEKSVDSNFFISDEGGNSSSSSFISRIEDRVKFELNTEESSNYTKKFFDSEKKHNTPTEHINFYIEAWKIHPFLSQKALNLIKDA